MAEALTPTELILPTEISITTPITGQLCMSGAILLCYSGSAWIQLSGTNTGD